MEELKKIKGRISMYQSYLKKRKLKYYSNGYAETSYNDMPYRMRINHKWYNKLVAKMDKLACEILKLQKI